MRTAFVILFTLLMTGQTQAQNGASAYSIFGIGDIRYYPNSRSAGMGYTGIGMPSGSYINSISPATWSRINQTRIDANFLYEGIDTRELSGSLYRGNGLFNGALIAIPIQPSRGITLVAGFTPYSSVNYQTIQTKSKSGFDYTVRDNGVGGLTKGRLGLSYSPLPDLAVGASFDYLFGTISKTKTLVPITTGFYGGSTTNDFAARGITGTISGLYTGFGNVSESLRPLSIGFVFTTAGNLNTTNRTTYIFEAEVDTSDETTAELRIPPAMGLGVAYQFGEKYVLAADYFGQSWSGAKLDGLPLANVQNSYKFGIGGERLPSKDPGAGWLEKLSYRLGFTFGSSYYNISGQSIDEWGVTGGFTIPISGEARIGVGLEYGSRGTHTLNLIKDNIFRLSMTLNLTELWFVRYEEE